MDAQHQVSTPNERDRQSSWSPRGIGLCFLRLDRDEPRARVARPGDGGDGHVGAQAHQNAEAHSHAKAYADNYTGPDDHTATDEYRDANEYP